jgi:hypothetical protein
MKNPMSLKVLLIKDFIIHHHLNIPQSQKCTKQDFQKLKTIALVLVCVARSQQSRESNHKQAYKQPYLATT